MLKTTISKPDQNGLFALIIKEPEYAPACLEHYEFTDQRISIFLEMIAVEGYSVDDTLRAMDPMDLEALYQIHLGFVSEEGEKALAEVRMRLLLPAVEAWKKRPRFGFSVEVQTMFLTAMLRCPELWPWAAETIKANYFKWPPHQIIAKVLLKHYREYGSLPSDAIFRESVELELDVDVTLNKLRRGRKVDEELVEDVRQDYVKGLEAVLTGTIPDVEWIKTQITKFTNEEDVIEILIKGAEMLKKKGVEATHNFLTTRIANGPSDGREVIMLTASDVVEEDIEWLWHNRFPKAKLSLLVGKPQEGKSWFTVMMAAHVSTGRPWPNEPHRPVEQGHVLVLQAEDGIADTWVKRLRWEGGDPQ